MKMRSRSDNTCQLDMYTLGSNIQFRSFVSHFGPRGFFKYESYCVIKFILRQLSTT